MCYQIKRERERDEETVAKTWYFKFYILQVAVSRSVDPLWRRGRVSIRQTEQQRGEVVMKEQRRMRKVVGKNMKIFLQETR